MKKVRNAYSTPPDCDYSACLEILRVTRKNFVKQGDALGRTNVRQTYKTSMLALASVNQLAEVGVDGNEDPALTRRERKHLLVTRIFSDLLQVHSIVTLVAQSCRQTEADTTVDKESQPAATSIDSRVSPAMTERA